MMKLSFRVVAAAAVALGAVVAASCGGGKDGSTGPSTQAVAPAITQQPQSVTVSVPAAATFTVAASGTAPLRYQWLRNGSPVSGATAATYTLPATAATDSGAKFTATVANAAGSVTSATATLSVTVPTGSAHDYAIVDAQFTQGVQDAAGSIPIILSGGAAVLNVLIRATPASTAQIPVVFRLYDAAGALVHTDTGYSRTILNSSPSYDAPPMQFLVQPSLIQPGSRWQVELLSRAGTTADDTLANNVLPRSGTNSLTTMSVPPLNIRFVPIVLASHANATGAVSDATIPQYLRTLRSVMPVGVVNAHVGTPLTTTASFGTPPRGGDQAFWSQVLAELDLARVADPTESNINWFGIVDPPAGFNFTTLGGISYIPVTGTATGPRTHTSVGTQLGWFGQPGQAEDLVAHELGHTFGRAHAPCGSPGSPIDLAYPVPSGTIDVRGFNVYSWTSGQTLYPPTVPTTTGDVMGYCYPMWASTYTYKAVMAFRSTAVVTASVSPTRALIVRGSIDHGRSLHLEPSFVLDARPTPLASTTTYRVRGLAADGRTLFDVAVDPVGIDHAPGLSHFVASIPIAADVERDLMTIVLGGPEGETRLELGAGAAAARSSRVASLSRGADGRVRARCEDTGTRGAVVIDRATGSVVGIGTAEATTSAAPAAAVDVLCSDGIHTRRMTAAVP